MQRGRRLAIGGAADVGEARLAPLPPGEDIRGFHYGMSPRTRASVTLDCCRRNRCCLNTLGIANTIHLPLPSMNSICRVAAIAATFVALAGCASAPVSPLTRPGTESQGEVIVFREYAFAAGGVGLAVGANNSAFASIGNDEKVRAAFPLGSQEFFVQARSAEPTKLLVNVQKESPVCLRTSASPSTYAKVAVPIALIATGYHFYLDEVPCPAKEELAKYRDVPVTYR